MKTILLAALVPQQRGAGQPRRPQAHRPQLGQRHQPHPRQRDPAGHLQAAPGGQPRRRAQPRRRPQQPDRRHPSGQRRHRRHHPSGHRELRHRRRPPPEDPGPHHRNARRQAQRRPRRHLRPRVAGDRPTPSTWCSATSATPTSWPTPPWPRAADRPKLVIDFPFDDSRPLPRRRPRTARRLGVAATNRRTPCAGCRRSSTTRGSAPSGSTWRCRSSSSTTASSSTPASSPPTSGWKPSPILEARENQLRSRLREAILTAYGVVSRDRRPLRRPLQRPHRPLPHAPPRAGHPAHHPPHARRGHG